MTTATHNSSARKDIMREVDQALVPIEEQIKALQEKRKEIKGKLKQFDIRVSHFNVMRQYARMEASARDPLFDVLREGFEALLPGQQASFLDVIDPKSGIDTAHVAKGDTTDLERPDDPAPNVVRFETDDTIAEPAKPRRVRKNRVAEEGLAAARAHLGIEEPRPATVGEALAAASVVDELPMGEPIGDDDAPQETMGYEREALNA